MICSFYVKLLKDKQTDKQTDKQQVKHNPFGRGNSNVLVRQNAIVVTSHCSLISNRMRCNLLPVKALDLLQLASRLSVFCVQGRPLLSEDEGGQH